MPLVAARDGRSGRREGLHYYRSNARLHDGVLQIAEGRPAEGSAIFLAEYDRFRAVQGPWTAVLRGHAFADALVTRQPSGEAEGFVRSALSLAEAIGEGECRTDLVRLLGRLATHAGDLAAAETEFRRAIDMARGQGALWWELRATRDLARLLGDQGRVAEARELLAPVYVSFTEGFARPDLVEAKTLLDELEAGGRQLLPRERAAAADPR